MSYKKLSKKNADSLKTLGKAPHETTGFANIMSLVSWCLGGKGAFSIEPDNRIRAIYKSPQARLPDLGSHIKQLAYHLLVGLLAALFTIPLLWVATMSLRQPDQAPPQQLEWLPDTPAWSNYRHIFEIVPLGSYLLNSIFVAGLAVPLTIIVASWAGFAMAQLPAQMRYILLGFAIMLRMLPISALWLPRFLIFSKLGLIDTYWALLAPVLLGSSPFFVLLFYWSFRRMPQALFDTARLEGMQALGIWARIALPNAHAAIMAVAVLTFAQYWSDFISPLLYLKSDQRYTLAVGLRVLQQMDSNNWPLLMAGVIVLILPIIVLFIAAQRVFVRS